MIECPHCETKICEREYTDDLPFDVEDIIRKGSCPSCNRGINLTCDEYTHFQLEIVPALPTRADETYKSWKEGKNHDYHSPQ